MLGPNTFIFAKISGIILKHTNRHTCMGCAHTHTRTHTVTDKAAYTDPRD